MENVLVAHNACRKYYFICTAVRTVMLSMEMKLPIRTLAAQIHKSCGTVGTMITEQSYKKVIPEIILLHQFHRKT